MGGLVKIKELLPWSSPKRVETAQGPRNLLKATPNEEFWGHWKANKPALKEAGISVSKDRKTGDWEICWWQPLSAEETNNINESLKASEAVDVDVSIPAPEGLEYLGYQRAGIAYALERKATLIGDEMGLGKTAVQDGLSLLARVCDGAKALDNIGFNGCDSDIGKSLAASQTLTSKQVALGKKILLKYHRQLPEEVNAILKGDNNGHNKI